jgi:hypothetical protein
MGEAGVAVMQSMNSWPKAGCEQAGQLFALNHSTRSSGGNLGATDETRIEHGQKKLLESHPCSIRVSSVVIFLVFSGVLRSFRRIVLQTNEESPRIAVFPLNRLPTRVESVLAASARRIRFISPEQIEVQSGPPTFIVHFWGGLP